MEEVTVNDSWNVLRIKNVRRLFRSDIEGIDLSASGLNYIVKHKSEGMLAIPINQCIFYIEK